MKTKAQIEFDFELARRRAAELEEISSNLSRISRRDMENAKAELIGAWRGENAQLFQAKAGKLQEEIKSTAGELNSIAAAIREIAKRIYEAEMEALHIAIERKHL